MMLFYVMRNAILPFFVGLVLAYIMMPLISWAEKRFPGWFRFQQTRRVLLILFICFVILLFIAMFSCFGIIAVTNAPVVLANNTQSYITAAFNGIQRWTAELQRQFHPEIQQQLNATLAEAAVTVVICHHASATHER
jgi:predicted PurR-regulated permease PerM